ncbi:MAG TPA: hypothetical protein VEA80_00375 [Vitreimonas sp.]|uniref:hypothetical protein n=1 Tax=Vitreimonas sp. TaxID=3069702 RepID=UPI002D3DB931|nr:hypothetical protein [Vitreimonas sp.]HYD85905.1 hypothetical protein [Vitreimonas sp.]
MLRLLGLLTGWVLLLPLALVIYLQLGGPLFAWMTPAAGVAASVPMLGFFTAGGAAMIFFSVRAYSQQRDDF